MRVFSVSGACAVSVLLALTLSSAFAKLPALDDAAKAKAVEAAAKTAWSGKMDAFLLCQAQNRAAANFFANAKAQGREVRPAMAMPDCVNPGPFVQESAAQTTASAAAPATPAAASPAAAPVADPSAAKKP